LRATGALLWSILLKRNFKLKYRIINIPCKSAIYAYILAKFYENSSHEDIVKEIIFNVYSHVAEEREGSNFLI
jgi:hypothetical protein